MKYQLTCLVCGKGIFVSSFLKKVQQMEQKHWEKFPDHGTIIEVVEEQGAER